VVSPVAELEMATVTETGMEMVKVMETVSELGLGQHIQQ
jgi:hypothetical protein